MSNSEYPTISANLIKVDRDNRQRRNPDYLKSLTDSIRQIGLINPITITRDNTLVAGERRLEACKLIAPDHLVTVRYVEDLPPEELALIEYEENAKRNDLPWKENIMAVYALHKYFSTKGGIKWTQEKTGQRIGLDQRTISNYIAVAERLAANDLKIVRCDSIRKAIKVLQKEKKRHGERTLNELSQIIIQPELSDTGEVATEEATIQSAVISEPAYQIIHTDFTEWAKEYSGSPFTFLHCDFPYGIGHDKSAQGGTADGRWEGYEDSEETYWRLCEALAMHHNRLFYPKAHMMFWCSMNYYQQTIEFFESKTNLKLVTPYALIWCKSDNKGIASDTERRPRHCYETALLFSRGDCSIIQPVSDWNAHGTEKAEAIHVSEKPARMLANFFRMFVDEHCEMLDPTCGSGAAIRAAASMDAKRAVGLEVNEGFAKDAQEKLLQEQFLGKLLDDTLPEGIGNKDK